MSHKLITPFAGIFFTIVLFAVGCSAQSEDQALKTLRQLTRDGKLPSEEMVAGIESRFAGKRAGALAKLLRARIRYENKDYAGAAALLNSDEFRQRTKVGDHALWLRASALQQSGSHAEAMKAAQQLLAEFPDSTRAPDARAIWAASAISSGQQSQVPTILAEQLKQNDPDALLAAARAFEAAGDTAEATRYYRRAYFYAAGTNAAKEAEAKLKLAAQPLTPQNAQEAEARARRLADNKNYAAADKAFAELQQNFSAPSTPEFNLKRLATYSAVRKAAEAQAAFNAISPSAKEKEEAYYHLAMAYARARQWQQARQTAEEMRRRYPAGQFTAKAWTDAGMSAREAKNKPEEQYFLRTAVSSFPNAVEVAGAQFELAWLEHESGNYQRSSQMLIEHLARYAEKDTTNRGKAGYWAARDSERAGRLAEACALYEGVIYRYAANWYGYIAQQRLSALESQRRCTSQTLPANSLVPQAVAALRNVTVAAETSTPRELALAEKSEDLSTVGLFDWAISELEAAKRTADNSPKINLALAQHYQMKGDNVNALLALAKSYPDYSQMFPEEMGREEWQIFYPLTNWNDIKKWARARDLDHYNVAGLIRQESVFNPRAKSHANAYGLMQLLIPTARMTARKFGSTASISGETLFQPAINIELGTAYMREQLDKFGRIEYMAVAYNAGPGRVPQWRATLPAEIDEFVEAIPFRETRGYVQGVIRNAAQYRRLYDENGNFKSNVGTKPLRGEIDAGNPTQFAQEFPDVIVLTRSAE